MKKVAVEKSGTRYLRSSRRRSTSEMAQLSKDEKRSEYATPLRTRLASNAVTSEERISTHATPYRVP